METNQMNEKDSILWNKAKKRSEFKWSLVKYLLVNACLVCVWALGDRDNFWPKWVILFWGLGVAIKYFKTYYQTGIFSEEKEYERLKKENN